MFRSKEISERPTIYMQMEIKEDPPSHMKVCGDMLSLPMIKTIFGDTLWNYNYSEIYDTAELTITPKTLRKGNEEFCCSLQLLKMAIIRLFQDDDFIILPNSMFVNQANGTEKLMLYKES